MCFLFFVVVFVVIVVLVSFFFFSTQNSGDEACIKVENDKKVTVVYACMVCLSKGCCFCVKHLVLVK